MTTGAPIDRPEAAVGAPRWIHRYLWVVILVFASVVVALVAGAPAGSPAPLDPASTAPNGTKALVLLLRAAGAQVHAGPLRPAASHGVAVVLQDRLNASDRAALQRWVSAGGRLVITDPDSPLSAVALDESTQDAIFAGQGRAAVRPDCLVPAMQSVSTVDFSGSVLLRPTTGQVGCFGEGRGDYLVVRPEGAGIVVVLGGPDPLINANLAQADDSVLASALMAPVAGTDVTIVGASPVGGGNQGLLGLISPRLLEAFWGLIGAFCLVVLWRWRRFGRPVDDVVPVALPGSELVVATGNLLQEAGHRQYAAEVLRADLRQSITDHLGIDPRLPAGTVAGLASARTGIPVEQLLAVLEGSDPASDRQLVAVAQMVELTRKELSDAR